MSTEGLVIDPIESGEPNAKADVADAKTDAANAKAVERRAEGRLPLQLKVAIVYHEHEDEATRPTFHGRTNDISVHGLSVLVGENIFNDGHVTVLLAIPPDHVGAPQKIIEATAKMAYTVFSSEHNTFRIGLSFANFKRDGKHLLNTFIEERRILFGRS